MADEQKPTQVPPVEAPAAETTPAVETPAPVAETPAEETAAPVEAPAAEATEAAPAEEAKEEVKPIEEGVLEAKGTSFPKNFLYTKKFFWFGSEAVSAKDLAAYVKNEKAADVAHHVVSWASETGKGLLFYGEKPGEKSVAHGAIQLADASEPTAEGVTKFQLTSQGHKHIFKASSAAERDNWVSQIKLKIAEAKELAATIPETETYKATLASLKPAKKEEKKEAPVEEAAAAPAEEAAAPAAEAEAAPVEAPATPVEAPKEEKKERRSASRKRLSVFGGFGKKEEKKEEKPVETEAPKEEAEAAPAEAPAAEEAAPAEAPAAEATEAPKEEPKAEEVKTPTSSKRTSIFGSLGFSKKKVEAEVAPAPPAKDTPAETAVSETAPVIPAVETSEPLSTDVAAPAAEASAEAGEAAATNGESKKEVKSEKRKSSLPFNFGAKKEKSDDEGEKKSPFSKFRATVRLNRKEKPAKTEEAPAEEAAAEVEAPKEEAAAEAAPAEAAAPAPAAEEPSEKPAAVQATPQVAATA